MSEKYVYLFSEADPKDKKLLGGKGAGLSSMTQVGLPVPPGFVVTTEACSSYYEHNRDLPEKLMGEVRNAVQNLEENTGKKLGSVDSPLLLSVRSGAAISMPGMMDTILNLGLNDATTEGLSKMSQNPRFAYDTYRRFISLFSKITLGVDDSLFDDALVALKSEKGVKLDTELDVEDFKRLISTYKEIVSKETGKPIPEDPYEQLAMAIMGVFASWEGKRCVDYRHKFNIGPKIANGTAVNVQTMVFGNMGEDSATGVAFTRDPATGENTFFGEYMVNAQGEDVVAGIRTPKPLLELEKEMPQVYKELEDVRQQLEKQYKEVQDLEFTIEKGKLHILQTRNAKMNVRALVKTSVDMVEEDIIDEDQAILRIDANSVEQLFLRQLDPSVKTPPATVGLPAAPGVAVGSAVFDADEAERWHSRGKTVILVREETKPEDIHGFFASEGILTSRGGKTSHAAVVARGIGKPCVSGAEEILIDNKKRCAHVDDIVISEGDILTIDGTTGRVWVGEMPTVESSTPPELDQILQWADARRKLGVRANANTPEEAKTARELGAQGIGLCRTERMFNQTDRLPIVQDMILAETEEERQNAIDKLMPMQKNDFIEILKIMEGLPVTIRLLDPPLHEFLPTEKELTREIDALEKMVDAMKDLGENSSMSSTMYKMEDISKALESKKKALKKVQSLAEVNPMLGHRGVRLGITYPEIYAMQIRAVLEAATELALEGVGVIPEIMIPQVCTSEELEWASEMVEKASSEAEKKYGHKVKFSFGTMIEVVRACMRAGKLAESAEFFSFGTNDLTQATFSFSREDAENKFLPLYRQKKILQTNPFEIVDDKGVLRLMHISIEWGRKARPDLKVGICGEHGGEAFSIGCFHSVGLDYVSCSVFRIPTAKIASAQAAVKEKMGLLQKFL